MATAIIKATGIGKSNTFNALLETSNDLPQDALGQVLADVIEQLWTAGEDPMHCTVVLTFS